MMQDNPKTSENSGDWIISIVDSKWNNCICKTSFSYMAFHSKDQIEPAIKNIKCRFVLENLDKLNSLLQQNLNLETVSASIKENPSNLEKYYWLLNNPSIEIAPGIIIKGEFPHKINVSPLKFND